MGELLIPHARKDIAVKKINKRCTVAMTTCMLSGQRGLLGQHAFFVDHQDRAMFPGRCYQGGLALSRQNVFHVCTIHQCMETCDVKLRD